MNAFGFEESCLGQGYDGVDDNRESDRENFGYQLGDIVDQANGPKISDASGAALLWLKNNHCHVKPR